MFHKKLNVCLKASDGSSSRDDLPAQLLRRNDQIRRLEAKLSGRRCLPWFTFEHDDISHYKDQRSKVTA